MSGDDGDAARVVLGPAAVPDDELAAMAAGALGLDPGAVRLRSWRATVVPYDMPAITTGGRWWVEADVATPDGERTVRWFVKVVHSFLRSPHIEMVPEPLREIAAAEVPWRTEPLVYRSDLRDRLPDGLTMPRADAVVDLDDTSAALWLEAVDAVPRDWTDDQLVDAARRLGRLAGRPATTALALLGDPDERFNARGYQRGRLANMIVPMLRGDDVWSHPTIAGAFDADLRDRLRAATDALDGHVEELMTAPQGAAHGDACPNNLLVVDGADELVLIDFGFWSRQPLGFDLGQLVAGEVQLGRRPSASLPTLVPRLVDAFVAGLGDEGVAVERAVIDRIHAVQLVVYTGLSAMPVELLDQPPSPALAALAAERAALARFALDRLEQTA